MVTRKESDKQDKQPEVTEFDMNQEIDTLIETLEGDLSAIEADRGLHLIDQWYGFLNKSKEPGTKELASGLKELQKLFKSDKTTGHEISEALIQIGEQTAELSDAAEKGSKQSIQRLGKQLRKAGTSIAKAEDQEYHQQLDSLVEKAQDEELTSLDADTAVGSIDLWYNLLQKAQGEQFQQVASSLKELKQVIKRNNAKPETVAKALVQVGEQTSEIASEAPRGFKGAIQKLGKQLTKAGESLTAAK